MERVSFRKQMPRNLIMNIISFLTNVLIGLWLIPYLVAKIGVAAYGLVPLAMVFTSYISVISVSINGAITRFITIDIENGNWVNANKTFNTALFVLLAIIIVQIPILSIVVVKVDYFLNVPSDLLVEAYYLFSFTFIGYLISLLNGVFGTSMYAKNRLDLSRTVDIAGISTRVFIIVLLFNIYHPSIIYIGIANITSAVITFLISTYNWRKLTPRLVIDIKSFDFSKLKDLTSMGGWLVVNMVGFLLFLKIDLIVINRYFGASETGTYAAVLQWNSLIRTIAGVLSGVIGPMILISYASNKLSDVIRFSHFGVKFLSLSIAVITGLISGLAGEILGLWLGSEFSEYGLLLVIMLFHLSINLGVLPLLSINTALNKVKLPGIISFLMGSLNLFLAIIFVKYFHWGLYGVAIAGGIALTLKNGLFTPWYAGKILNINAFKFFKPLISGPILYMITFVASLGLGSLLEVSSWLDLFIDLAIVSTVMGLVIWGLFLNKEDRRTVISLLPLPKK